MSANNDEMVTLKELVQTVMRKWKIVAAVILTVTTVTAIFNFFIIRPVYLCEVEIKMTVPDKLITEAGEYIFYPTSGSDYMDYLVNENLVKMTIASLDLEITIEDFIETIGYNFQGINRKTTDGPLVADIKYTGKDRGQLPTIANKSTEKFIEYTKISVKRIAIIKFLNQSIANNDTYSTDLSAKLFKLDDIRKILLDTPKVIVSGQTTLINPVYEALEGQVAGLTAEIAELKSFDDKNNKLMDRLTVELSEIEKYYIAGDASKLDNTFFNILDKNIEITKFAKPPEGLESPRRLRNIVVAFFLSTIAGIVLVLTMNYWKKF